MKKLSYITTIIFIICLFAIPSKGFTELTLLTESELGHITAQAGFSDVLDVFGIKHDENTGSYYFGSDEGGYLSLAEVTYDGVVDLIMLS